MLCHGPVRVPTDAASGKAFIRFVLPTNSGYDSVPTELAVELVAAAARTDVKKEK